MEKGKRKGLLLLLFTLLFNFIFWREAAGLNLLLFTLAINSLIFYSYPNIRGLRAAWLVAIGGMLGAIATVVFNSGVAQIATIVSICLLNGYAMFPEAKSNISAFAATVTNLCGGFLMGLIKYYEKDERFEEESTEEVKPKKWKRYVKLGVIPVVIAFTFYIIFSIANPVFAQIADRFNNLILDILEKIFSGWTIERVGFTLLGAYLILAILYHWLPEFFPPTEANLDDKATERENESTFIGWLGLSGIKDETLIGAITLVLVNLLFLTVNVIDVNYLWFNFNYEDGMDLSSLVHEGTYWLIFSILLAMGILMYFFRGNQNFNKDNTILKILSYTWVLQNVVMIVSVVIRNYRYIDTHGLTYKRIGVYVFLLMTFMGLLTLIVKISSQRSNFFLWRINSWLAYGVLVLFSFWNWDGFIANYNIKIVAQNSKEADVIALPNYEPTNARRSRINNDKVDIDYLLALSDKALPALLNHPNFEDEAYIGSEGTLRQMIKYKYERLERKMANSTWLSYNWADSNALQQLKEYFDAHPDKVKEVKMEEVDMPQEPVFTDSVDRLMEDTTAY
jgi:hypothetical protein